MQLAPVRVAAQPDGVRVVAPDGEHDVVLRVEDGDLEAVVEEDSRGYHCRCSATTGTLAARTSKRSIVGSEAGNRGPFSLRALATTRATCAWRPLSSANASMIANVDGSRRTYS